MSYIIKPGKNSAWKKHLRNNLLSEIIMYEKVIVNTSHAKMFVKNLSKVINWAKKGDLHSRRLALRYIDNRKNTLCSADSNDQNSNNLIRMSDKLFNVIAKKYEDRNSGFIKINKLGFRRGDASEVVIVTLV